MPVTKFEVSTRAPYAGGRAFGDAGPYEYLAGALHYAIDPAHPNNQAIVDIGNIPTTNGKVTFSADVAVLKPVDPPLGGRLIYDVVNRGNKTVNRYYNWGDPNPLPDGSPDPGDGFLMRHGFTVVFGGWQVDVPAGMRMAAPVAREHGQPVRGQAFLQFTPIAATKTQLLSDRGHQPVPAHDVNEQAAALTVRDHPDGPAQAIPRSEWQFARDEGGQPVPDNRYITTAAGFDAGKTYELVYTASNWPVVGLAFLATRDAASFFLYGAAEQGNPCAGRLDHAYAFGSSMSGRYLRELMYWGLNEDEEGRQVFGGLHVHIGSARRGEFNFRFGQPSTNVTRAPGNTFPFSYTDETDALTGESGSIMGGLIERGRAPKVIATNSGVEYWWSGASLTHTDVHGERDLTLPDGVRVYFLAGSQHIAGTLELTDTDPSGFRTGNLINPLDYTPVMRAMLLNLDCWVHDGVEPPPSQYPRIAGRTAVGRETTKPTFEAIPGARFPKHLALRRRLDFGPDRCQPRYPPVEGEPYITLVSALDADGNELAGVRLPDTLAPLGTYTGWNVRHADVGGEGEQVVGGTLLGSVFPFAKTVAERTSRGDPRTAVDERYASKDGYLAEVKAAAERLAADRYVLADDVVGLVELAGRRWDLFCGQNSPSA
jgi:hypothetical protein